MEPVTEVMFRHEDNQVLAVFPYEIADYSGNVSCYAHLGQHSGADYQYILDQTSPALPAEYADLKAELERIGYVLKVIKRRNHTRYIQAYREARK